MTRSADVACGSEKFRRNGNESDWQARLQWSEGVHWPKDTGCIEWYILHLIRYKNQQGYPALKR